MNGLNSVLLEGTVARNPEAINAGILFVLETSPKDGPFRVACHLPYATKNEVVEGGMGVRIVGKLGMAFGKLHVVVASIEVKHQFDKTSSLRRLV